MKRRRAGSVAAAMSRRKSVKMAGGKKKSTQAVKVVADDPLSHFGSAEDTSKMFGKRVFMLEKILKHKHATDKTVLKGCDRKDVLRQRQIDGLGQPAAVFSLGHGRQTTSFNRACL